MFFDLENPSDSEDDCDYEPPSDKIFAEEEAMPCSSVKGTKTKGKARKKQNSSKAELVTKSNSTEASKSLTTNSTNYEKKRVNDVYENFLKEIAAEEKNEFLSSGISFIESNKSSAVELNCKKSSCNFSAFNTPEKLGEIVVKSVSKNYNDTPNFISGSSRVSSSLTEKHTTASAASVSTKRKGLESVLNILDKKQKTTTLTKSLLDWKKFKEEEGIEEELALYNRGKGGFIERKRFLERSDLRCFEIERGVRLANRQTKAKKYV